MPLRLSVAGLTGLIVLACFSPKAVANDALVIDLWPGKPPGETLDPAADTVIPPKPEENPPTHRLTNVTRPQITVYQPPADANTGVAMLVCPGGGFNHLAYDKEGTEVAQWLTTLGITGVVLKYRCPTKQEPKTQHLKPLQDAQRALNLISSRAAEWNIDSERIGVCGFSAGGKVAVLAATNWDHGAHNSSESTGNRPAFAVLIYPALANEAKDGLDTDGIRVTAETPPTFIVYSWDDRHPSPGALHLALALKEAGVSCELHQYASGGHGYGMRPSDQPVSGWPMHLENWLRSTGLLSKEPS